MIIAEPLAVSSLSESAAQVLRDAIVSGNLHPGQRLVELKLASSLGIGQPTLREALKELQHQGYVRKTPNHGTYVTSLTHEDFHQIHEVRLPLESIAFEKAALRITAEAARELKGIVASLDEAARRLNRVNFHNNDIEFHRKVWRLSGNKYLEAALEGMLFAMFAFVMLKQKQSDFRAAVEQHRKMLAGLLTGDPSEASAAFRQSTLEYWRIHHQLEM